MDYLRNLGSALVQKSGLSLPFSLGQKVTTFEGLYTLYDATKREDGSPVSVFEYDFSDPSRRNSKSFAQNALKKLRTTRHPDVLKFMDAVESDTSIYIMTERVQPLSSTLPTWAPRKAQEKEDWLLWGLHRISVALTFLNDPCASTHGRICSHSIFISPSGEWKLGGFELLSNPKDEAAVLYNLGGAFPSSFSWSSPEVKKNGWSELKQCDPAAPDAYALGLLLYSVFNPTLPPPETSQPPHPPPTAASRGAIPSSVFNAYKKLLNPNPKNRLTCKGFLELGMTDTGFFAINRLVKVCLGLENFSIESEAEKNALLKTLKESTSSFPTEFTTHKVLPSLVSALEFGGASAATILPLVIQFSKNMPPEDYPTTIVTPLVKLYASPDRGTRMALLDHLPDYIDKLDKKTVSDKIFPHLQTGFSDTVAVIREATTKSISLFAPKLTDRLLNNDLLRLLAKMQMDPEPSIRTNTCILIGRLGPTLGYNTKRKVLVPAFVRALKDTFVHARVAGLMAFMATIDCFEAEDIATKVLPNITFTMIDKEKLVRDQAFKTVDLFVKKLEEHAKTMPEIAESDPTTPASEQLGGMLPAPGGLVNSATGAAGALAGWAMSSLGKRVSGLSQSSNIGELPNKPFSTPTTSSPPSTSNFSSSTLSPSTSTKGKGLQLGGSARGKSSSNAIADFAKELEDESSGPGGLGDNPWGNDDLMDINADEDDWSAFETAPAPSSPSPTIQPQPTKLTTTSNTIPSGSSNGVRKTSSSGTTNTLSPPSTTKTRPGLQRAISPVPSNHRSTPVHSPPPSAAADWSDADDWGKPEPVGSASPAISTTSSTVTPMTKEEKVAEMARRKEERKQRIAMLKEQKKNAAKAS
ncbi:N-terminal kinase-like protein [Leucoagaricus sp. SymC.cos]|nr:N-terminal kinase-like protein [Leucoagaricus sp. SymC.cos]